jgi:glycosyltransferase involved in cell wall biosynthesis
LPLSVLTALARLPERVKLRIVGYETLGSPGYLDIVRDNAATLGVGHRLHLVGEVPTRRELLRHCLNSHIGLALMPMSAGDPNLLTMAGASNKPFDYLACGLGLVVSDLPEWTSLYVGPGYAMACNPEQPISIERAIRSLIDRPERMRAMGELGRQRVQKDWNYDIQFAPVFDELNRG